LVDDENARAQTFAADGVLEHLDLDAGNEWMGKRHAVDCAPFLGVSRCSSCSVGDGAPTRHAPFRHLDYKPVGRDGVRVASL
jgi:hypothetical protein